MYSHQMVGSNDIARSKTFYDALFSAMGGKPCVIDERGCIVYAHNGGRFLVTRPIDGEPATHGNGSTIGFLMESPAIEDSPRPRQATEGRTLYLAYLRGPPRLQLKDHIR